MDVSYNSYRIVRDILKLVLPIKCLCWGAQIMLETLSCLYVVRHFFYLEVKDILLLVLPIKCLLDHPVLAGEAKLCW